MRLASLLPAGIILLISGSVGTALAHEHFYDVTLSAAPGNSSPGSGVAHVTLDLDLVTARVEASFSGLLGATSETQIHCCTAVAGSGTAIAALASPSPAGFPLSVTSGVFDITYDLTDAATYNPLFISAQGGMVVDGLNALIFGAEAGTVYLDIRTSAFPDGEIRGFLVPVPEPGSQAMLLAGLAALGWAGLRPRVRRPAAARR